MSTGQPPREEEQSIRARKQQLFEADAIAQSVGGPKKPFRAYVQETPAAPLSLGTKAILWAVAAVVVLLLIAAFLRGPRARGPARRANAGAVHSSTWITSQRPRTRVRKTEPVAPILWTSVRSA